MKKIENQLEGVVVVLREDESIQSLIKRFKKKVSKNEIMKDIKRHMFYEKPSRTRKRKRVEAESRRRKEEEKRMKGRNINEKD